ncbi:Cof-type HAD-IIB family hydrolase [Clostridium ganghwense]|uniref:Cof-type HAD-IIB family hydrolase n=1 Tax=Clostridium ganghwense TaxID=312089 RepID=A0ABT4CQ01_9CLOT|nr:Cof-type HAD-IIB family hydrolase [Clostridium ganghwense]MCY6371119.1 Cof-type HAD-IIB family hydrolase [Clostridium ganghwense]
MYKLIAIDMDGTLLKDNKTISKKTYDAIQSAKSKGVKVVLSTGRPIQGIEQSLKYLTLTGNNDYIVACSGSVVQCVGTKKFLFQAKFLKKDIKYLYDLSKDLNITLNGMTSNYLLTSKLDFTTKIESHLVNLPIKLVDFNNIKENLIINSMAYINETHNFINKLKSFYNNIDINDSNLEFLNTDDDLLSDLNNLPSELRNRYTLLKTSNNSLEILKKDVNKGTGVATIAKKLGIKRKEIICIGDSGNDIHMIEFAGLGVAMGNAFPEVKEIANYITLTNEEDGVAHVINKFILKK